MELSQSNKPPLVTFISQGLSTYVVSLILPSVLFTSPRASKLIQESLLLVLEHQSVKKGVSWVQYTVLSGSAIGQLPGGADNKLTTCSNGDQWLTITRRSPLIVEAGVPLPLVLKEKFAGTSTSHFFSARFAVVWRFIAGNWLTWVVRLFWVL